MAAVTILASITLAGTASAQSYSCAVPGTIQRPKPDLPSASQPRRVLPIGGYTLAVTWAPRILPRPCP